jgi:hypothetical protein
MAAELARIFALFGLLARYTRGAEGYRTPNGAEGYGEVGAGSTWLAEAGRGMEPRGRALAQLRILNPVKICRP